MSHPSPRALVVLRTGLSLALAVLLSGCIIVPARPHYYRPAYVYPY